jgi:hypothetical protein
MSGVPASKSQNEDAFPVGEAAPPRLHAVSADSANDSKNDTENDSAARTQFVTRLDSLLAENNDRNEQLSRSLVRAYSLD